MPSSAGNLLHWHSRGGAVVSGSSLVLVLPQAAADTDTRVQCSAMRYTVQETGASNVVRCAMQEQNRSSRGGRRRGGEEEERWEGGKDERGRSECCMLLLVVRQQELG